MAENRTPIARLEVAATLALILASSALVGGLCLDADVFTIDSYYYLAKARSLGRGELLRVPWNDGVDRMFFWGYSFALALPLRLFGEAGWWLLQVALYAAIGVLFARIVRRLPLSPAGRLGALALLLFNPVCLWWATIPMSEALLLTVSLAAVLQALRWREAKRSGDLYLAAVFGGLALLTRAEGVFLALALLGLCGPRLLRERRFAALLACVTLFALPESFHLLYLALHGAESAGLLSYLDVARAHFAEVKFFSATWSLVRAPYWPIFRFDTEPWLYARFFPGWLPWAMGVVLVAYLSSAAAALASGVFHRGFAFACAATLLVFAAAHSAWFYVYERFMFLVCPLAALLVAWGLERAFARTPARLRGALVLSLALLFAAVSGAYGARVSQMHAERLKLHQGGRDYRAIARAVNGLNPEARPVVTDLGPYLAFYLTAHSYFDRVERDFYDDVVPAGESGRVFLAERDVAAVASGRPAGEVVAELALVPGEYHLVGAPGASVVALELPR